MLPEVAYGICLKEKWPKKSQMSGAKEGKQWESLCKGIMEKKKHKQEIDPVSKLHKHLF